MFLTSRFVLFPKHFNLMCIHDFNDVKFLHHLCVCVCVGGGGGGGGGGGDTHVAIFIYCYNLTER